MGSTQTTTITTAYTGPISTLSVQHVINLGVMPTFPLAHGKSISQGVEQELAAYLKNSIKGETSVSVVSGICTANTQTTILCPQNALNMLEIENIGGIRI